MPADAEPEVAMPADGVPEVATPADALALAALAERTRGAAVVQGASGGAAPVVAAVDAEPAWIEVVRAEAVRAEVWELEVAPSCVQPTVQLEQGSASVEPELLEPDAAGPVSPVWGAGEVRLGASLRKKKEQRLVVPARAFVDLGRPPAEWRSSAFAPAPASGQGHRCA